jgi:hypothetical protein
MRLIAFPLVFFLLFTVSSCKTHDGHSLEGTWGVADVKADFDERRVNPSTFNEIVSYLRDTKLEVLNDSTIVFSRGGVAVKSGWHIDSANGTIVLDDKSLGIAPLVLFKGQLRTYERSPLGRIQLVFDKKNR